MATITLTRFKKGVNYVIGKLTYPNGECFTLEHIPRPVKIQGRTGIPAGVYYMRFSPSQRFRRSMPFVMDVPGFRGVMIHTGNNLAATRGCILLGEEYYEQNLNGFLKYSREAFQKFRNWFASAWATDVVMLKIIEDYQ